MWGGGSAFPVTKNEYNYGPTTYSASFEETCRGKAVQSDSDSSKVIAELEIGRLRLCICSPIKQYL